MICKIIDLQNVPYLQNRTSATPAGNVSSRGARGQRSHRSKRLKENTWRDYINRICGNTRCCAMFTKFNLEKKNSNQTIIKLSTLYDYIYICNTKWTVVVVIGSWIFNQSLSSLTLWVRIPLMARCTRYNIMW